MIRLCLTTAVFSACTIAVSGNTCVDRCVADSSLVRSDAAAELDRLTRAKKTSTPITTPLKAEPSVDSDC